MYKKAKTLHRMEELIPLKFFQSNTTKASFILEARTTNLTLKIYTNKFSKF